MTRAHQDHHVQAHRAHLISTATAAPECPARAEADLRAARVDSVSRAARPADRAPHADRRARRAMAMRISIPTTFPDRVDRAATSAVEAQEALEAPADQTAEADRAAPAKER